MRYKTVLRHLLFLPAVLLLITTNFSCGNNIPSTDSYTNMSLIVSTINDSSENRLEHLMKYQFYQGELVSTETIVTHPVGNPYFPGSRIYQNRYLINDYGDIADIQTKEIIYSGGSNAEYVRLKGVEGDNVVVYSEDTDEYYSYDLEKRECSVLANPGKWALPGILSPDQNKSVTVEDPVFSGCNEILLHILDGTNKSLGSNFCQQLSMASSHFPSVPIMWLDNESIITQVSNGEIVILKTDATIEPIVTINLSQEVHPSTLEIGLLSAYFTHDPKGNIIYALHYAYYPAQELGANVKQFTIDIVNKSYSLCCTEWIDIGYGFEAATVADDNNCSVRYNGEYIGQVWFTYYLAKTAEGHLAVSYYDHEYAGGAEGVKVWSSASEKWTTIDYESPIWMDHEGLIGWIEE